MRRALVVLAAGLLAAAAQAADDAELNLALGNAERGRLVFGQCRTCHYVQPVMGHNIGPNLSGLFGRVVGRAEGFDDYSPLFREAGFVWTPQLLYRWLENPMAMFPESSMMSNGVPDPVQRADLVAYLRRATLASP